MLEKEPTDNLVNLYFQETNKGKEEINLLGFCYEDSI
jgi:hypothetical protein